MLVPIVRVALLILVSLACTVPAQANWISDFIHSVVRDTKRRNCWPKPFTCPDFDAVRAPFAIMVENGWRRQNMLGDHHFDSENNQLTESGRLKLRWVLTEAPRQHRVVYVNTADTAVATAERLNSVRLAVTQLAPEAEMPPILETDIPSHGWSAERVDSITRKFQQATPEPVLPSASSGDGGG